MNAQARSLMLRNGVNRHNQIRLGIRKLSSENIIQWAAIFFIFKSLPFVCCRTLLVWSVVAICSSGQINLLPSRRRIKMRKRKTEWRASTWCDKARCLSLFLPPSRGWPDLCRFLLAKCARQMCCLGFARQQQQQAVPHCVIRWLRHTLPWKLLVSQSKQSAHYS